MAIDQWVHPSGSLTVPIPKYGQCLNAMHEAENALTDFQWFDYDLHLEVITKCDEIIQRKRINATASQRREAYLRTLNLYVE